MASLQSSKCSAVDAIIAEAMDLCALEQIAKLNTSHLSDSFLLPTDLEARFRKLKSFPGHAKENIPKSLNRCIPDLPTETEIPSQDSDLGPKPRSGSSSSPSISRSPRRDSPSPPKQVCCFGLSPRKMIKNKEKDGGGAFGMDLDIGDWGSNEKILTELKDQKRKLKKAMKEQDKLSREAAQIVKIVKQASARMNAVAAASDDELLSDDEELK
ncbi:uncharacterized protein [Typha angustifolia]|uniref:uncharacterized protein n=1 Tax=Typha angustifolia TaxID=59011 RepID=UPI003C3055D4